MRISKMDNEGELSKELEKLSISSLEGVRSNMCQINIPNEYNKLFIVEMEKDESYAAAKQIFTNTIRTIRPLSCRRCRLRRNSESTLDELKMSKLHVTNNSIQWSNQGRNTIGGTLKQVLKSTHGKVKRRIILREPILKALQTCFSPHNRFPKRFMLADHNNKALLFDAVGVDMSMGHGLILKCHRLLKNNTDFSVHLTELNLTTDIDNKCIRLKDLSKSICNKRYTLPESIGNMNISEDNGVGEFISTNVLANDTQEQSNTNSVHSSNTDCSDNMRLSTSYSQQASTSTNNNSCDDVTIDELASYFDTFVYIPKKMSSMAEMMYI